MDYILFLLFSYLFVSIDCQHEDIPYENIDKICETCQCQITKVNRFTLNCADKNFKHILSRWPEEFGDNHNGIELDVTFSANYIGILQQLPATNSSLTFSCRHCNIYKIQAPTFIDVPKLKKLDLSWNQLESIELTPNIFRGPYQNTHYVESISLNDLDLSHNAIHSLKRKLFEYVPNLKNLNLSFNKFNVLDSPTTIAISGCSTLEFLDLSYNDLISIPVEIFKLLVNLKFLSLNGNKLKVIPENLYLIGNNLESILLSDNPIEEIDEKNFIGLKKIKMMNISYMPNLEKIHNGTFLHLTALEYLISSHNSKLKDFHLDNLKNSKNLTHLDISYCSITKLSMDNFIESLKWDNLRTIILNGNPWKCDCEFLKILEKFEYNKNYENDENSLSWNFPRCSSPDIFAGVRISNLSMEMLCSVSNINKFQITSEKTSSSYQKRYIVLGTFTIITAALGLAVGFLTVYIRRKLRKNDFNVSIEPVRYTTILSTTPRT